MATNKRRVKKDHEVSTQNGTKVTKFGDIVSKTVGDVRNESKSKAQMKKDWGNRCIN